MDPIVELRGVSKRYGAQVALARALVLEPAVLLDEPLATPDEKLRKQMQVELKRLRERLGITFLFVTHDQQEALVMSDRVAVINRGCLEQVGSGEEIYENPRTRFVAEFMGIENFFEVTAAGKSGEWMRFAGPAGLALWAKDAGGVAERSLATLAVRPEEVRLSLARPEPTPRNLLAGEVIEVIYEGGSRRWAVQVASGQRLVVRGSNARADLPTEGSLRGAKVFLSWEPERSLVFPHESSLQAKGG